MVEKDFSICLRGPENADGAIELLRVHSEILGLRFRSG
jgi:hypothetical protein